MWINRQPSPSGFAYRFESVTIEELDPMCVWDGYDAVALERRQRPAHRLDRQAQIVRYVVARHRQVESFYPVAPVEHLEKESGDPLGCGHAAQQQCASVRIGQIAQHCIAQQTGQGGVLVYQPLRGRPLKAHDDNIVYRFGRVETFAAVDYPEPVAAEAEFSNVASAISEKLADPYRAGDDFVPAIRSVALGVDLVIARKAQTCADALQCHEGIELTRLRNRQTIAPRPCEPVAIIGVAKLPVHDLPPAALD